MASHEPRYLAVVHRVESLVARGTLKSGDRIPSLREMAKQTGSSLMTVLHGYQVLEDRGIIASRPQAGYYVLPRPLSAPKIAALPPMPLEPIRLYSDFVRASDDGQRLISQAMRSDVLQLGAGLPDSSFLPNEQLSLRMSRVVRGQPDGVNRYDLGSGDPALRAGIAKLMLGSGANVAPDEILVTPGATPGLLVALRAVASPGDAIALESPGYYGFYAMLRFLGLRAIEIPSDPDHGISPDEFERALAGRIRIRALVISSAFSNPSGSRLSRESMVRIAGLCRLHNVALIDDDTYGELYHGETRPHPPKSLAPDDVIHIGSFSKILAPGYRIGWIAGGRYQQEIRLCHSMAVLSVALPNQLAIAAFLADGGMSRHLRRLRLHYRENLASIRHCVAASFPEGTSITDPQGGYFLWVRLPDGVKAAELAELSIREHISVAPGTLFSSRGNYAGHIRLNGALPWSDRIEQAIQRLGALTAGLMNGKPRSKKR